MLTDPTIRYKELTVYILIYATLLFRHFDWQLKFVNQSECFLKSTYTLLLILAFFKIWIQLEKPQVVYLQWPIF